MHVVTRLSAAIVATCCAACSPPPVTPPDEQPPEPQVNVRADAIQMPGELSKATV